MPLEICLEEDLGLDENQVRLLRERLRLLFPEVHDIDASFISDLSPDKLKHAYIQQAATCHPKIIEGLSKENGKSKQNRYRQLTQYYKLLLPQIRSIHRGIQRFAIQNGWDGTAGDAFGKHIIAVGGAKGGVGKSALSANVAVGLALMGHRVVLADLDLGGADVHLYVGVKSLKRNWNDFLDKKVDTIDQIQTPTAFEGLTVVGGNASRLGSANLHHRQKIKMMRHLRTIESDFIIMDLGGDTSYNVLDFFLLADQKIVVTGTEPASILDTYSFIKVAFHRFLDRFFRKYKSLRHMSDQIRTGLSFKQDGVTMTSIVEQMRTLDSTAYAEFKEQFEKFQISLVVNMIESRKDLSYAKSMTQLVKDTCAIDVDILGTIPFDTAVRKAARRFTPFLVESPRSKPAKALHRLLSGILLPKEPKSVRAELLKQTGQLRGKIKLDIEKDEMQLDQEPDPQILPASKSLPNSKTPVQKTLGSMTT